jgi:GNAT superfamily N-acetyltransferase
VAESAIEQDINRAVGERWRRLDPLLPEPGEVAVGCGDTFFTPGKDGFAVCRHVFEPASSLAKTWGAATTYALTPRLAGPDIAAGLDQLLTQWRDHIARQPEAHGEDSATRINWPSRDIAGVRALQRHGFLPMSVIAARRADPQAALQAARQAAPQAERAIPPENLGPADVRVAGSADVATAVEFQLGVIRYDEQVGIGRIRPATEALVRADLVATLARQPSWIWLAERKRDEPLGMLILEPPERAAWIAPATSVAPVAYLATMFVRPAQRGAGIGAALVREAHAAVDEHGVGVTLLHYAQVNPLSGPFWSRMGYRPLWTTWQTAPAGNLR